MTDVYYRTGPAAKLLGLSSYELRRLAETGLVAAEYTGKQWRIPASEVERLQKEGVPPIPASPNDQGDAQTARRPNASASGAGAGLLGPPSEDLIASTEQLVATENLLKQRKLERELAEVQDWFTDRESAEAEREREIAYQDHARQARDQAEQDRDEAVRYWEAHAVGLIPRDAPADLSLQIQGAVRAKLQALNPMPAPPVVRQIVEAIAARLLAPWIREKEITAALVAARDTMLPPAARGSRGQITTWQSRAIRAAAEAIKKLPDSAPLEEIRAVATQAVAKVAAEFAHGQACEKMAAAVFLSGTPDENVEARQAAKEAMGQLPIGAPQKQMEAARDAAIHPTRDAIARRQAQAQAAQLRNRVAAEAAQRRAQERAARQGIVSTLHLIVPWGSGAALTPAAREAVAQAVNEVPEGAPPQQLEAARDAALRPHLDAHAQAQRKEAAVSAALRQVLPRLAEIEARGRWDYEGETPETLARQFAPAIRKSLEAELTGAETPDQVARLVRRLVRGELEAAPAAA